MGSYPEWQGRLRSITIDSIVGKITIVLAVFFLNSFLPNVLYSFKDTNSFLSN